MARGTVGERIQRQTERHWVRWTLVGWLLATVWFLHGHWNAVHWMSLGDTDDNMRLMQVRGLLSGQGWYDLRQYRLNPPAGFDIHWSRIVDLPIAGLILFFRLFTSNAWAERLATGIAPLIPLGVAMLGMAATVRRLISPYAWPLALLILVNAGVAMQMFMPERIDHHGWQLAMLSLTVAGLCDSQLRRGGAMIGIASAISLSIGLEMLPYAAMAGAIVALGWIQDRATAPRLAIYGITLGAGSGLGYVLFASEANRVLRCDALTPVWLSVMVAAGGLLVLLALAAPSSRAVRLGLTVAAGAAIVAGFAWSFPQCLGRPEQVSPELAKDWLNNVREAKPIYLHPFRVGFLIAILPLIGLAGAAWAMWRARGERRFAGWIAVTLFAAFATALLLWQIRSGPAAQMLAAPGVTALAWFIAPRLLDHRSMLVRVGGTAAAFVMISGIFAGLTVRYLPGGKPTAYARRVNLAGANCARTSVLTRLNRYPGQVVFTFVDLGPRLIVTTHHDAIAGPYHRNGPAILDVQHAFTRSPTEARAIMQRHKATLLLVCPNMAESTIYRSRAPDGFYGQLAKGKQFGWLTPMPIAKGSPLRLFRID